MRAVCAATCLGIIVLLTQNAIAACGGASPNLTAATWADVQPCVDAAANGDTITLAAGTHNATTQVAIISGVSVTVQGVGAMPSMGANGATVIRINTSDGSVFGMNESTAGHITLQNMKFTYTTGDAKPGFAVIVINSRTTNGKVVLAHHLTFTINDDTDSFSRLFENAACRGVFYRIVGVVQSPQAPGRINQTGVMNCDDRGGAGAMANWQTPATYGMADTDGLNNAYIETSTFTNFSQMTDVLDAGRMVFRYNTATNSKFMNHGFDSGQSSARHWEVYNNHFVCSGLGNVGFWVYGRGGTGPVTDNVFDFIDPTTCGVVAGGGTHPAVSVQIYRLVQDVETQCWPPPYPTTYPVALQTGWGYTSGATTSGWGTHGTITSSGGTATFTTPAGGVVPHRMTTGDTVVIQGADQAEYNGTFTITSTGTGTFTYPISGSPASPATTSTHMTFWSATRGFRQDLEPLYFWNNTNNANGSVIADTGVDDCHLGLQASDYFQENREWYARAPQIGDPGPLASGYTKFTYPHPLATVTGSDVNPVQASGNTIWKGNILIR